MSFARAFAAIFALAVVLPCALPASAAEPPAENVQRLETAKAELQRMKELLSAAEGAKGAPPQVLGGMRELVGLAEETLPFAEKLVQLEARYPDAKTVDELDRERTEPYERFHGRRSRLTFEIASWEQFKAMETRRLMVDFMSQDWGPLRTWASADKFGDPTTKLMKALDSLDHTDDQDYYPAAKQRILRRGLLGRIFQRGAPPGSASGPRADDARRLAAIKVNIETMRDLLSKARGSRGPPQALEGMRELLDLAEGTASWAEKLAQGRGRYSRAKDFEELYRESSELRNRAYWVRLERALAVWFLFRLDNYSAFQTTAFRDFVGTASDTYGWAGWIYHYDNIDYLEAAQAVCRRGLPWRVILLGSSSKDAYSLPPGQAKWLERASAQLQTMKASFAEAQGSGEASAQALDGMRGFLRAAEEALSLAGKLIELEGGYLRLNSSADSARRRLIEQVKEFHGASTLRAKLYDMCLLLGLEHVRKARPAPRDAGHGGSARPRQTQLFSIAAIDFFDAVNYIAGDDQDIYYPAARQVLLRRRSLLLTCAGSAVLILSTVALWAYRRRRRAASPAPGPQAAASSWVIGGNFRVLGELGRGGMGVVYEAMDLSLRRKVAIKKMREEIRQSPADLEQFLTEARLVAALKHPHIVEIHGVVREREEVYLVFEFVKGRTLSQVLAQGPLPLDTIRGLFAHVAAALDYAHSQRVIHRDLKPSNIMVTDERIAKVMDFGLAHQAKMTVARLTRADAGGTPAYMAPEQELGSVSRESDLYALGVCLYEMATGKLPFEGPNFLAQKRSMRNEPPSKAGLPAGLDAVIEKALQPEPAQRYHCASEMLAALSTVD